MSVTEKANSLESLQQYANNHWATDKTRLTKATFKRDGVMVTEKRLWFWLMGDKNPILMKERWLTGVDRRDFGHVFQICMGVGSIVRDDSPIVGKVFE